MSRRVANRFDKSFTRQEGLPPESLERATSLLAGGRLHRYDVPADGSPGECASLEAEFARYQCQAYCLACASGGYALQLALRAVGVQAGEAVLTNAFTLSPVPGRSRRSAVGRCSSRRPRSWSSTSSTSPSAPRRAARGCSCCPTCAGTSPTCAPCSTSSVPTT